MKELFKYKRTTKKIKNLYKFEKDFEDISIEELKSKIKKLRIDYKKTKKINYLESSLIIKKLIEIEYKISLFNEQLIAGILLSENYLLEMKTGEGKTFAAIYTALISFIKEEKFYISTANDYLAKRDAEIAFNILDKVNIKVSYLSKTHSTEEQIKAYKADLVYSTLQMFAFDYLKDNLVFNKKQRTQRIRDTILIDEADLALIDQSRSALSLTGNDGLNDIEIYKLFTQEVDFLSLEDDNYEYEKDTKTIVVLDSGYTKIEDYLINKNIIKTKQEMYLSKNLRYLHIIINCLKAKHSYINEIDYVIIDEEIVLVDEKTGRLSEGQRLGNGLHQALEAKEDLEIIKEKNIVGSITIHNYLKKFKNVSGMSGTVKIQESEFKSIYKLRVVEIPTHKKNRRIDSQDLIFLSKKDKFNALVEDVKEKHKTGQPIMIGTITIESSMEIADLLYKEKLPYNLLNAKNHKKESKIIESAGKKGAITIATNMAGRGTDIMLGGNREVESLRISEEKNISKIEAYKIWEEQNKEVNDLGGLYIIGSERNTSRRMDNQLIGRSGRQGDHGLTQFYVSIEDEIIDAYGFKDKMKKVLSYMKGIEGNGISHPTLDIQIETLQKKIEGQSEEARKSVLGFDDINEEQRNIIYSLRNKILNSENNLDKFILSFTKGQFAKIIEKYIDESYPTENWDLVGLENYLEKLFNKEIDIVNWFENNLNLDISDIMIKIENEFKTVLSDKKEKFGEKYIDIQKELSLKVIDNHWSEQLSNLTELKNRVFFRSYAQQKPLEEYQKEIYYEFKKKINNMEEDVMLAICNYEPVDITDIILNNFRFGLSPIIGIGI
jgi:preprotein translocase subunit SecA